MCVFCSLRGQAPEHEPGTIAPDPFDAFPYPNTAPNTAPTNTALDAANATARVIDNEDDTAPDSVATTNSMDVGDTFLGRIDYDGDTDWIAIDLTAGQIVDIRMSGFDDNRLTLYNSRGFFVEFLEEDQIIYEVETSGTHYIEVETIFDFANPTGDYTVTVTGEDAPDPFPPTRTAPMQAIDWGSKVNKSTISYHFADAGYVYDDGFDRVTAESWNAYERGQMRKAFDLIEEVIDVTFVQSNSTTADFVLIADRNEIDNLGFFVPPGEFKAGEGVFAVDEWDRSAGGDLEIGGFGFATITHEVLHGLGLAHPHDRGGRSSLMQGVDSDFFDTGTHQLNQGIYTTMSYNPGFYDGPVGSVSFSDDYGTEAGPMALDIAVLQDKYGANTTHAGGDDVYDLPDANRDGTYYKAIWDTGGSDTLRYSGARDATLDLRAATLENEVGGGGFVSAAKSVAGGYTIAFGVEIENAESGSGDDRIEGNDLANALTAGVGNDSVSGGDGNDTIFGGNGSDSLLGMSGKDEIRGGAGRDTIEGGWQNDALFGGTAGDRVNGGKGRDRVEGGKGYDTLGGGDGSDTLRGGNGNDKINGGNGPDTLFGGNGRDNLNGNSGSDVIYGGNGTDTLLGGNGNDTLNGEAGDDTLTGGNGSDLFVFDTGGGVDTLTDFSISDDRLAFTTALADGRDASGIAQIAVRSKNDVVVDFGNGAVIVLEGLESTENLADIISII